MTSAIVACAHSVEQMAGSVEEGSCPLCLADQLAAALRERDEARESLRDARALISSLDPHGPCGERARKEIEEAAIRGTEGY